MPGDLPPPLPPLNAADLVAEGPDPRAVEQITSQEGSFAGRVALLGMDPATVEVGPKFMPKPVKLEKKGKDKPETPAERVNRLQATVDDDAIRQTFTESPDGNILNHRQVELGPDGEYRYAPKADFVQELAKKFPNHIVKSRIEETGIDSPLTTDKETPEEALNRVQATGDDDTIRQTFSSDELATALNQEQSTGMTAEGLVAPADSEAARAYEASKQ